MEPDLQNLSEWDEWWMKEFLSETLPGQDSDLPSQIVVISSPTREQDLASNEDIRR